VKLPPEFVSPDLAVWKRSSCGCPGEPRPPPGTCYPPTQAAASANSRTRPLVLDRAVRGVEELAESLGRGPSRYEVRSLRDAATPLALAEPTIKRGASTSGAYDDRVAILYEAIRQRTDCAQRSCSVFRDRTRRQRRRWAPAGNLRATGRHDWPDAKREAGNTDPRGSALPRAAVVAGQF
jgi:hypothetical protein